MKYTYTTVTGDINIDITPYWYTILNNMDKDDYNNWRKLARHSSHPSVNLLKEDIDFSEQDIPMKKVADKRAFFKDQIAWEEEELYANFYRWICNTFPKEPDLIDAFIAHHLEQQTLREYAKEHGMNENNLSKKLKRFTKKLQKKVVEQQILDTLRFF